MNENKSAIQYLDRIKDIEPENPKYLYLSSKLALKNGDLNKAKRILTVVLQIKILTKIY